MVVFQSLTLNHARTHDSIINLGPYALRRSVNKFSSSALGKINKFLLRSFIRQFAGSSSVKFLFLLCARQNKQVSFTLAYASVPAHAKDNELPRHWASNAQASEWKFTYTYNERSHYSPKASNILYLEQFRELSFLG